MSGEPVRNVILHYHLFKNAGTSIDAAFKETFGADDWLTAEFPSQLRANHKQVAEWILDNPKAKVFSSHTAYLPPPKIKGVRILPVVFLRHPLDRIASVYAFETQQSGNSFGAVLARNTDLSGYIETRLSLAHDRQCRNFHVHRLAMTHHEEESSELARALKALDTLPFIGVVERFSASIEKLEDCISSYGFGKISLPVMRKNVSRPQAKTVEDSVSELKNGVASDVWRKLQDENKEDIELYHAALRRYDKNEKTR